MTAEPGLDVFLSYSRRDGDLVAELQRELEAVGLVIWRDETSLMPSEPWQPAITDALARAKLVLICVGPTGLQPGQLQELGFATARAASDPDVRYAAALLPGVPPDFPASALPSDLAVRQWVDLRAGVSGAGDQILGLLGSPNSPPDVPTGVPTTPSVDAAAGRLSGEVTAAAFVLALMELHPEYGEGMRVTLDADRGDRATPSAWIDRVRALLTQDVKEIHGRLLIVGLARLDAGLREQLTHGGFLGAVEREIREPLAALFLAAPEAPEETVPTHTDNPATIDELNREGIARILARRIRDTRASERGAVDPEFPRGRSFLVHVHGPWGVGKTSLLNFLRAELRSEPEPWVVVTFNAWQHQRLAPPWWWLLTCLYEQGAQELERVSWRRAVTFRCREWLWRLRGSWQGVLMIAAAALILVVSWRVGSFDALSSGRLLSGETLKALVFGAAAILTPLLTVWGVAHGVGRWLMMTSARGARVYIEHARDPMDTVRRHFADLVDWFGPTPVAILIDDLDRCKPPYAVELLEGIQTLFRDVPVAYVVAADREWLATGYTNEYSAFQSTFDEPGRPLGYLFLEKTFQLTVPVPVMSAQTRDQYWRHLIRRPEAEDRDLLSAARAAATKEFASFETEEQVRDALLQNPGETPVEQRARVEAAAIQLASPKLERSAEHVLHPFRPLLDANPRAMKRLVNAYGLARGIELLNRHTLGGDKPAQQRTALWTILSLRWPPLAEYLAAHPGQASRFHGSPAGADGFPADISPLVTDPEVCAVVRGAAEGVEVKLDPDSVRLCISA